MSLCVKTPLFLLPWQTEYYWSVNSADVCLQACICCFSERLCHSGPLPVKTQATTKPSLAACSHSSPSLPLSTMTPPLLLQALRLNTAVLNKQCLWHLRGVIVTWSGCQSATQTQRTRWSENLLIVQREGVCVCVCVCVCVERAGLSVINTFCCVEWNWTHCWHGQAARGFVVSKPPYSYTAG